MIYKVLTPTVFLCTGCGASIISKPLHDAFHATLSATPAPPIVPPVVASAPPAPTGLSAVAIGNHVALSWVNPTTDPVLGGNNVYRGTAKAAYLGQPTNPVQSTWTDTNGFPGNVGGPVGNGLAPGTYTYGVSSYSVNGESTPSATVTVTVTAPLPPPPVPPVGTGNRAAATAGMHFDNNASQVGSGNSSANSFALGCKVMGTNFPWTMIESTPDPAVAAGVVWDLAHDAAGNYKDGRPVPSMVFSLYGAFTGASCAQVAAGAVDGQLATICGYINEIAFPQVMFRFGWELDGGWFNWSADPVAFKAAYIHVHDFMNARLNLAKTPGGVLWEWNAFALRGSPTAKNQYGHSTMDYWVGPAYADVIGCDTYRLNNDPNDSAWLDTAKAAIGFAITQGLQVAFTEWGLWDCYNGSPATLEASGASVRAVNDFWNLINSCPASGPGSVVCHLYFWGNPGTGQFSLDFFPKAMAAYKALMAS